MAAVTRIGDADITHCTSMVRAEGSSDVFANGKGISRAGDHNTAHLQPPCDPGTSHASPITSGSSTVFINGKGCGRVGDAISGCTAVAAGSPDVFAG